MTLGQVHDTSSGDKKSLCELSMVVLIILEIKNTMKGTYTGNYEIFRHIYSVHKTTVLD